MEQSGFRPEDEPAYKDASYGWQRLVEGAGAGDRRAGLDSARVDPRLHTTGVTRGLEAPLSYRIPRYEL